MPADESNASPQKIGNKGKSLKRLFGTREIIVMVLILLSIIGIGITDYFPDYSRHYWFSMVIVFGGACLILEWSRARGKGQKWTAIVKTQLLLWVGLFMAVYVMYLVQLARGMDNADTGLVILLLLALTTFFAGVNLGWRLLIVGLFLGVAVIGAAYLEHFAWIFFIVAIVIAAVFLYLKHHGGARRGKSNHSAAKA